MRRERSWVRPLAGLSILGILVWRVGGETFLDGLRHVDAATVSAAAGISLVTTLGGAWRWALVARGLGTRLPLAAAVAESYRSQFLNVTLPGGVLGDVHRGVRHGRGSGDVVRGLRSVVWERLAGQVVLGVTALTALLATRAHVTWQWPTPLEGRAPAGLRIAAGMAAGVTLGVVVAGFVVSLRRRDLLDLPVRLARAAAADVRAGLLGRHTWPGVVGVSVLVVAGHVCTFVLAVRATGVTAPVSRLLPLALVVLVAMGLPINIAGWGPREGVAAWAFAAAGLGAAAGVEAAVVYGVLAFASALPGAAVTLATRRGRPRDVLLDEATEGVLRG